MALVHCGGEHGSPAIGSDERNPCSRSCRQSTSSLCHLSGSSHDSVVGERKTSVRMLTVPRSDRGAGGQ